MPGLPNTKQDYEEGARDGQEDHRNLHEAGGIRASIRTGPGESWCHNQNDHVDQLDRKKGKWLRSQFMNAHPCLED